MIDPDPEQPAKTVFDRLHALYARIDVRARALAKVHEKRLNCDRGCSSCCVDDITVNTVEAGNIRSRYHELLATGVPHDAGTCAFLDGNGLCRIYDMRPYVCRTQGLPLHWIDEPDSANIVAMRDICPLNDAGTPLEQLAESECWIIGPVEEELAVLEYSLAGNRMGRIKLRDLFGGGLLAEIGD